MELRQSISTDYRISAGVSRHAQGYQQAHVILYWYVYIYVFSHSAFTLLAVQVQLDMLHVDIMLGDVITSMKYS